MASSLSPSPSSSPAIADNDLDAKPLMATPTKGNQAPKRKAALKRKSATVHDNMAGDTKPDIDMEDKPVLFSHSPSPAKRSKAGGAGKKSPKNTSDGDAFEETELGGGGSLTKADMFDEVFGAGLAQIGKQVLAKKVSHTADFTSLLSVRRPAGLGGLSIAAS
jgi:hypothetical protein